jgi:hypothetical protein
MTAVRKFKAEAKVSMMAALDSLELVVHPDAAPALESVLSDVAAASRATEARITQDSALGPIEARAVARLAAA